jgi:hypothetical protein
MVPIRDNVDEGDFGQPATLSIGLVIGLEVAV